MCYITSYPRGWVPSPTREWVLGILGHLGRIGYLTPYLVLFPSDTGFTPRFVFILDGGCLFQDHPPPKNQEHQEHPIHPRPISPTPSLVGLGAHPLGYNLIPILGVIMCCMGFYLSPPHREGGRRAPLENGFLVFLVILVVLDILYFTWGAVFHPEDSYSPSTCAFFSKNPRTPRTPSLVGLGAHPLGYNLIPILGVIMCCMGFYLSPPHREGGRRALLVNPLPEIYGDDHHITTL